VSISRWTRNLVPFVAIGAVALAACGSDSSSSGTTATTQAAAATTQAATATTPAATATTPAAAATTPASVASGEPIKLMTIGPVDAPGFSLPSIPVGAGIAIKEINDAGGINGRQLELVTCNDKNDPNVAAQCAKQAIDEKVVAVVGGLSIFEANILPGLQKAGIPWVGLTSSASFNAAGVYMIGGDGASTFTGIGAALAKQGCKNIAILLSAQSTPANAPQIQAGILSEGAKVATTLNAPANGADWAPTVAAARAAGADCIAAGTGPSETGPLISAIKAGPAMTLAVADGGLPDVVLSQIGAAADGVLAITGFLPAGSGGGGDKLGAKIQATAPNTPNDQFAKTGYASVQIVAEASKGLPDVTAASLSAALPGITNFDTGFGPVVSFATPNTIPGYERIFNPKVYIMEAKAGAYGLAQPDPIDMTAALKKLSEGA
jgi:ABC-type branched-subunit amino acid transport system substrate-binding protein